MIPNAGLRCLAATAAAILIKTASLALGETAAIPLDQLGAAATRQAEGDGLAVTATEDGARLRCAFQRLEGEATPDGLWLRSTAEKAEGERFRVVAVSVGRVNVEHPTSNVERPMLSGAGRVAVDGDLVRFLRPGLIEEYSVNVDGVRQDFVVAARHAGASDLRVELALTGARAESASGGATLIVDGSRRRLAYGKLWATDALGRDLPARMRVLSPGRVLLTVNDAGAAYPVRIDPTISDADWVSMNPGMAGADGWVRALAVDANGHLYLGGRFLVAGTVAANHIAKWDGSEWSALGLGTDGEVKALAISGTDVYAGGTFTSAGGVPANNVAKWDGNEWSALGSGVHGEVHPYDNDATIVNALAVVGTDLYAGGNISSAGEVSTDHIARWDGSQWSALSTGMDGDVDSLAVSGTDLYAGGTFDTAGGFPANNVAKWDGSSWSALGPGLDRSNGGVKALAVMGTDLYAGGSFWSYNNIARWNGSNWSALGSGLTDSGGEPNGAHANALAAFKNRLYVGGRFWYAGGTAANHVACWTGGRWVALGEGADEYVHALAASESILYIGGEFSGMDGTIVRHLAEWSGTAWSTVGPPLYTREWWNVTALAAHESEIYAAVQHGYRTRTEDWFTVEWWNGDGWSTVGSLSPSETVNPYVNALTLAGDDLYVGGKFDAVSGVLASNVARWDGSRWHALGSGIQPYAEVHALAVLGRDVYVGGSHLTSAGGVPVNGIARWDGSRWSALGSGVGHSVSRSDGAVYALAANGTNLYVGGYFTSAGGVSANNVARWDGRRWWALGAGTDDMVRALAVMGSDLYTGGWFESAGGLMVNGVARWNGTTWSPLGAGVADDYYQFPPIMALAVEGTDLYAGGGFATADGGRVHGVARWDGSTWSSVGSGVHRPDGINEMPVEALAMDGLGHLFVGGTFTLAGKTVSPCIAQVDITGLDFTVSPIASPQVAGVPFPVTVTARNSAGAVVTSRTEPVTLSAHVPIVLATEIDLGTGTNLWDYPLNSRFHDARTQVILLADDIGPACTITSLSIEVISPPGQTLENWTIRMLYTDDTSFSSSGMWKGGPWTVVYQADEPAGTAGWRTFVFDSPEFYNGEHNLLVDFSFNNSSYSTPGQCRATSTENYRSNVYCTDSEYGDPLDWITDLAHTGPPRPVPSRMVPNIVLGTTNPGMVPVAVTPAVSGAFVDGLWTGEVTIAEAYSGVILRADDGFGHDGESNLFDVLAASLPVIVTDDGHFGLTDGCFGFNLQADEGRAVVIEISTDLAGWLPVKTNTMNGGPVYFSDPATPIHAHQYYRLLQP